MSVDSGMPARGTAFKRGSGLSPETFTQIAEVTDITFGGIKLDTIEVQHLLDSWKQRKPTFLDGGDVKLALNFIPADATQDFAAGLLLDQSNRTLRNFQVVWPDNASTTWTLPAFVTDFAPKAPLAGKLTADVTLTISGQPTLA